MSRVMASPTIRYGGESTVSPSAERYQATAASTSGTQIAVWASPRSIPRSSTTTGRIARGSVRWVTMQDQRGVGRRQMSGAIPQLNIVPGTLNFRLPDPSPASTDAGSHHAGG